MDRSTDKSIDKSLNNDYLSESAACPVHNPDCGTTPEMDTTSSAASPENRRDATDRRRRRRKLRWA